MKKLFAVLMTLALVLSMGTIAFAAGDGTITINNAVKGETFDIYKMFDFAPVDGSDTQGRYTVVEGWQEFLDGNGAVYLKANAETGTIEWIGATETDDSGNLVPVATAVSDLARAAISYADDKNIPATKTQTASADGTVVFNGLDLGYYAIDTTLGTVCALTNTNSSFEANEKNQKPDIDKFVQEDSEINNDDEGWGKVNDAQIGETVNYKVVITVGKGQTMYIMSDLMSDGLTFNDDVVAKYADGTPVSESAYYTVPKEGAGGYTFAVVFDGMAFNNLLPGDVINVFYSATVNENAIVATDGNDNTVKLTYRSEHDDFDTAEHKTTTYTWKMDVFKYTDVDTPLAGAKFQLLYGGNAVELVVDSTAEDGTVIYRVATAEDKDNADVEVVNTIETPESGLFDIIGLDEGSYVLRETEAPEGYNLAADIPVVIDSTYYEEDEANLSATYTINDATPATIKVENKTGGLLPETGGIGTTIFYAVGGLLMVAAVIFLVSKKRMAAFA